MRDTSHAHPQAFGVGLMLLSPYPCKKYEDGAFYAWKTWQKKDDKTETLFIANSYGEKGVAQDV